MGGRHITRRRISRAQQTKNWCVGFFPTPCLRRHPPNFIPFRVSGKRPKFPLSPICLALVRGLVSSASGALRGGLGFHGRNLRPPGASEASEASGSLVCGQDVGFGSGFRVFWPPSITPCQILNFSIFQATSWRRLASGPPERHPEDPEGQGCWV